MRFGVIGSNVIVTRLISAAKLCEGFVLQATCSRDPARARDNAAAWGAHSAYADVAALAADPLVEAVYIASPNRLHFEQAQMLIAAGKHVLVEKPATLTRREWETLCALAGDKGVLVLEAMRPAFLPGLAAVQAAVQSVAPVRYAQFPYCQYSSRYDKFRAGIVENAFDPTLGNGALMDIGVYCAHWMAMLFGRPETVEGSAVFLPGSIDAVGSLTARYEGLIAHCDYSKVHDSDAPCRVEGENGTVELWPFPLPKQMRITPRGQAAQEVSFGHQEQDMAYEITAFMRLCAHPADAEVFQQHTLHTLWVLDTVRAQAGIDFVPKPTNA